MTTQDRPVKLTLLIPTYNRCMALQETMALLVPQLLENVELLIVDSSSPDETRNVVADFQKQSEQVRYHILNQKGGIDRDYDLGMSECRGEWVWLVADDDLPEPDAVETVLSHLSDELDLLVINADVFNHDFSRQLFGPRMSIKAPLLTTDMDELFRVANDHLSFIAGVCIRRSVWLERAREPYYGTEFIHLGVIFQAPLTRKVLILPDVLLHIRYGVGNWTKRSMEVWLFKWPKIAYQHRAVSEGAKQILDREPWRQLRVLVKHRAFNSLRADTLQLLSDARAPFFTRAVARGLTLMPPPVVAALTVPYAALRGSMADKVFIYDCKAAGAIWKDSLMRRLKGVRP
jgi:glycosyltransferase involved in cell wall biosynthesis